MPVHIEIDFVSDVACPWCAIGLASLEEALRRCSDAIVATLRFHPFELNPDMRPEGESIDEFLGRRHGADPAQLRAMRENIRARAASVGFEFNQNGSSRICNTFDAHRLLHWAQGTPRQHLLKHALFSANFTDNADVSDHGVLLAAATSAGMDAGEAGEVLASARFGEEVREAEKLWMSRGIHAVPVIIFNGKSLVSGARSPETFERTLRQITGA
jgi:predicted DsbA family dithiol-disulfide isomerase